MLLWPLQITTAPKSTRLTVSGGASDASAMATVTSAGVSDGATESATLHAPRASAAELFEALPEVTVILADGAAPVPHTFAPPSLELANTMSSPKIGSSVIAATVECTVNSSSMLIA